MKKLAKELLIVVVAICFTVGTFTALAGMPFLFGNIFGFNGNAFIVPNAGLNGLFGGPLGGVNPLNGAPGTTTVTPGAGGNGGGAGGGATVTPGAAGGNAGGGVVAPGGGANALPNAAALNQKVDIKDGSVDPMLAIVPTTGTVTWKNTTTKTYKIIDPLGGFSSPAIAPAGTFTSPAFNVVGMFKYTVNNSATKYVVSVSGVIYSIFNRSCWNNSYMD